MNLLMIIIIVLGIWVGAAICYFAWQLVPKDEDGTGRDRRRSPADGGANRDD